MTVTDAAGDATQYDYDGNGELIRTVDPLGNVTLATYDGNCNLTSITGPTGLTTSYTYANDGEPDQRDRPAGPDDDLHLRRLRQLADQRHQPPGGHDQLRLQRQRRPDLGARTRRHVARTWPTTRWAIRSR